MRNNVNRISSLLGGSLSLLTVLACLAYAYSRFTAMFVRSETRFVNYEFNKFQEDPYVLSNYNDSVNFIIGLTNKSTDIHDNPYFEFNTFEMNIDYKFKDSHKIPMRVCQE